MPLIFNIMCLIDNKRFRFTFKRIPIKKILLKAELDNGEIKYKSPIQFTFIYKKSGILLLIKNKLATLYECGGLIFEACFPHHLKSLFYQIKALFNYLYPFPRRTHFQYTTEGKIEKGYEFNFGFFYGFKPNEYKQIIGFRDVLVSSYKLNKDKFVIVNGYIPPFTRYAVSADGDICARKMILNI